MSSSLVFVIVLFSATPQSNPSPSPTPLPQVTDVTLTRTAQDLSPAIRVSWSAVSGSGITYTVCYSEHPNDGTTADPPADAKCDTSDTDTSTILSPLSPGTLHYIWVAALSSGRRGPFSSRRGVGTYRVPSAVGRLSITQAAVSGQLALIVSWSKPQSELTITGYDVEYKVSNAGSWTTKSVTGANTLSTTLTNLEGGRSYDIRVKAVSPVGGGGYSPVQTQKAGNVPSLVGRPTVTQTAVSGRPALRVSWSRPQSDALIIRYEVQYRVSISGSWATVMVTGASTLTTTLITLTAGRSYDVRVRAVSSVGNGAYSNVQTRYLNRVPSAVATPTVMPTVASSRPALRVSWSAPESDLTITRFDIQYRVSNSRDWRMVSETGSGTVSRLLTRLEVGTSYDVQVRAVSTAGNGAYSNVVGQPTYGAPEAVTDVQFTVSENGNNVMLTVTWSSPSSDVDIIHYKVQYQQGSAPVTTIEVEGLQTTITTMKGKTYQLRVTAVSDIAEGPWSSYITVGPPTTPIGIMITSSMITLSLTWNDEGFNYRLYVQKRDSAVTSIPGPLSPPYNITGLESNIQYTVVVEAYNPLGRANATRTVRTLPGVPGPISSLNYTVMSDTSARITWGIPEEPNGVSVGYRVVYGVYMRSEGQKSQSTDSNRRTLDITGLPTETPIHVSVRAETSIGLGEPSTITFFTKEGVPTDKPKNVKIHFVNDTHVNISWDPLSLHEARGWPSYTVFMKGGMGSCASILQSKPTGASSIVMGDLDPASSYSVTVQVQTSAGTSDALRSEPVILEKQTSPTPSANGDSGLSVGLFIAGMVSGVLALLLVEGIIWGACKISISSHKKSRKNVDLDVTAVEMTDCPAYESVDRMYEDIDKISHSPKQTDVATS